MPNASSLANLKPAWQPGQSAYSGKQARTKRRVPTSCRLKSLEMAKEMYKIAKDPNVPPQTRLNACVALHDRAWGKPKQQHEITDPSGVQLLKIEIVDSNGRVDETVTINGQPVLPAPLTYDGDTTETEDDSTP